MTYQDIRLLAIHCHCLELERRDRMTREWNARLRNLITRFPKSIRFGI